MTRITLPAKVAEQLEVIRVSGETNMMDRRRVQLIANDRYFYDLVVWIEDHQREYGLAIIGGFDVAAE